MAKVISCNVQDKDTKHAIEVLIQEFENAEEAIKDLESDLEDSDKEICELENTIADLQQQVKDLEEALAEAHLTGEADDGKDQRKDDSI